MTSASWASCFKSADPRLTNPIGLSLRIILVDSWQKNVLKDNFSFALSWDSHIHFIKGFLSLRTHSCRFQTFVFLPRQPIWVHGSNKILEMSSRGIGPHCFGCHTNQLDLLHLLRARSLQASSQWPDEDPDPPSEPNCSPAELIFIGSIPSIFASNGYQEISFNFSTSSALCVLFLPM